MGEGSHQGAPHKPDLGAGSRHFGIAMSKVFAPLLVVVLIPDVSGLWYFLGTSTTFGRPPFFPVLGSVPDIIRPVIMPLVASVLTPISTSPTGMFSTLNTPSSSAVAVADPPPAWATITKAIGTGWPA